jgi:argininosuccinate lyase
MTTGYHRDLQLLKETVFPDLSQLKDCLQMTVFMLEHITIKPNILEDNFYAYLFSVEEVNRLVLEGTPFRDAYKKVGMDIEAGEFRPSTKVEHSHEGSIGNLCLDEIKAKMQKALDSFDFEYVEKTIEKLLSTKN